MSKEKNIPMRVVKEETGLTARQIRYYDEVNLIFPDRSSGNQRLFSKGDISRLKKIKNLIDEGYNISSIKKKLNPPQPIKNEDVDNKQAGNKQKDMSLKRDIKINKHRGNKLKSLYPVSNRSYLTRVLENRDNKQ